MPDAALVRDTYTLFSRFTKRQAFDGLVKSPGRSLRGARRRGNPSEIQMVMRLPRFARNDKSGIFGLFTS